MGGGITIHSVENSIQHPAASSMERGVAFSLDVLFCLCAIFAATVWAPLKDFDQLRQLVSVVLSGYWIFCHIVFRGRTLGKRILGLRVVEAPSQLSANIVTVVLRETLGRIFSVLLFPGFILIFLRQDGRLIHDFVGRSMVISEGDGIFSAKLAFFFNTLLSWSASAAFGYALLFTPMPFHLAQKYFPTEKFKFQSVEGNIASGFQVKDLQWEMPQGKISASAFDLKYDLKQILLSKRLLLEGVRFKDVQVGGVKDPASRKTLPSMHEIQTELAQWLQSPFKFEAKQLHLQNVKLDHGNNNPTIIDQVYFENIKVDETSTSWDRLYAKSRKFIANFGAAIVDRVNQGLTMKSGVEVYMYPELHPVIKSPFKFSLITDMHNGMVKNLQIFGPKRSFNISMNDTDIFFETRSFSPQKYFQIDFPVSELNLTGRAPTSVPLNMKVSGTFKLRHAKAILQENRVRFDDGVEQGMFTVDVRALVSTIQKRPAVIFKRIKGRPVGAEEYLSYLYFGRPPKTLGPILSSELAADVRYFEQGIPDIHMLAFSKLGKPQRSVSRIPTSLPEKKQPRTNRPVRKRR